MKQEYLLEAQSTLIDVVKHFYPDSSNTTLRDLIKSGIVSVDGTVSVKSTQLLEVGQKVGIGEKKERGVGHGLTILYEDRYLVIIDKPEGLLSVPLDLGEGIRPNALDLLNSFFHTSHIFAVHRLDKEVSGVMVFARGKRSASLLSALFKKHDLTRTYFAVVQGNVKEDQGTWESLLVEAKSYKVFTTRDESEGVKAITHFEVTRRTKKFTFMQLTLETGKKHQIRVHTSEAGHPIVGDRLYGDRTCNPLSRMGLHSKRLEFIHPFTGKEMKFEAPLPRAFSKVGE